MNDELQNVFDRLAPSYDQWWERTAPIHRCLYFLLESIFEPLPSDARVLCVGVGTGAELLHLARRYPGWRFVAVEPSAAMLELCRQGLQEQGFASRCQLHEGYLDSLPEGELFDAATCFLVSQFILDREARVGFFRLISQRLRPSGILASADLSFEVDSDGYDDILHAWQRVMSGGDASAEGLLRMKATYAKDVGVLPPAEVASIIEAGGFHTPVPFFQAAMIRGWFACRA